MFKKKEPWNKPFPEKLAKRVSKIATPDLLTWVEQALSETSRSVYRYQTNSDEAHLEEMLLGAEAINCLVSEFYRRTVL